MRPEKSKRGLNWILSDAFALAARPTCVQLEPRPRSNLIFPAESSPSAPTTTIDKSGAKTGDESHLNRIEHNRIVFCELSNLMVCNHNFAATIRVYHSIFGMNLNNDS